MYTLINVCRGGNQIHRITDVGPDKRMSWWKCAKRIGTRGGV